MTNRRNDRQRCTHGSLGIVFVCLWVAEYGENSVAAIARSRTAVRGEARAATPAIGIDHRVKILGVEGVGYGRIPYEIAEEHRQVSAPDERTGLRGRGGHQSGRFIAMICSCMVLRSGNRARL